MGGRIVENSMSGYSLERFAGELSSKAPVPGGGGASALGGALASALASMVCELTRGKKRYAQYEADIARISARALALRDDLIREIDGDAEAFAPLARAYSIPKDDPERASVMEAALETACAAPMRTARLCCEVIDLLAELAEKGSAIAVSDVGVGALFAKAALLGAGLNVRINLRTMQDRERADALAVELDGMMSKYATLADETYARVCGRIDR